MCGSVPYPAPGSEGSISSKNVLTSSLGLGVALIRGLRLHVVILSIFPFSVVGMLRYLSTRMFAVLISVFGLGTGYGACKLRNA